MEKINREDLETLRLIRAFRKIKDPAKRRELIELMRSTFHRLTMTTRTLLDRRLRGDAIAGSAIWATGRFLP